jgi:hypothetical protein
MVQLTDSDIRNLRNLRWQIQSAELRKQAGTPGSGACQKQGNLGQNPVQLQTPTSHLVANQGLMGQAPQQSLQQPPPQPEGGNSARMATLPGPPGSVAQGPVNNYGPLSTGAGPVALDGNHARGLSKSMGMLA